MTVVRRSRWYRAENGEQRAYPTSEGSLLYVRPAPQDGRLWEWGTRADGYCHVFGYKLSPANAKLMAEQAAGEIWKRGVRPGDNRRRGNVLHVEKKRTRAVQSRRSGGTRVVRMFKRRAGR